MQNPTKVELIEDGKVKLTLTKSDAGSLNDRKPYTGRADAAVIHGPKGSVVTFFDNQQFREDENFVTIETKVDGPVLVPLSSNFVGAENAQGQQKIYMGSAPKFDWMFFRRQKPGWWDNVLAEIPGGKTVFSKIMDMLKDSDDPRAKGVVVVVDTVIKQPDENYRVDNCSSVRFGS
jgi:hypothetical protein